MSKSRLLFIEDDVDTCWMFSIYFGELGYEVDWTPRGSDGLEKAKLNLPHLITLDIMLPDIDGYEVCRNLRTNMRTSHIPVIFLTQKDERSDKLQGLELGSDDYITKPFDIEEFKIRVASAIKRSEQEKLTDSRSGLPGDRLIEEQLRRIIREKDWALLDARINNFEPFKDVYGFVAGDDVMRFTAMLFSEVVDELGTSSDFIGHISSNDFIVITRCDKPDTIKMRLKERFDNEVATHYSFMDRQQGFFQAPTPDGTTINIPFMNLSVGVVSPNDHLFTDIRELIELAYYARRQDTETGHLIEERLGHFIIKNDWAYLHLQIQHFDAYLDVYEKKDSNEVISIVNNMIKDIINELQIPDTFISHPEKDTFVVMMGEEFAEHFSEKIKNRFREGILFKYLYIHREQGYIRAKDREKHPFMKLAIGIASRSNCAFSRAKEIMEFARHACASDAQ